MFPVGEDNGEDREMPSGQVASPHKRSIFYFQVGRVSYRATMSAGECIAISMKTKYRWKKLSTAEAESVVYSIGGK